MDGRGRPSWPFGHGRHHTRNMNVQACFFKAHPCFVFLHCGIACTSEAILYHGKYDAIIAAAIRLQKDVKACMQSDGLKEVMIEIDHQYLHEVSVVDSFKAVPPVPANVPSPEQQRAQAMIHGYVKLLCEEDACELAQQLGATGAGRVRGEATKGKFVLIVYDVKVSGEASPPPCRQPSWRPDHYEKLTTAVMRSRKEAVHLHSGDLYLGFDGGKPCVDFAGVFSGQGLTCAKRRTQILYTDINLVVKHEESVHMVTAYNPLALGSGSSNDTLTVPEHSRGAVWKLTPNGKNAVFGKGGATVDDATVPVFPHSTSLHVAEGLIAHHGGQAVLDLTAGDGVWAVACLRAQIPYTGIVITRAHQPGFEEVAGAASGGLHE